MTEELIQAKRFVAFVEQYLGLSRVSLAWLKLSKSEDFNELTEEFVKRQAFEQAELMRNTDLHDQKFYTFRSIHKYNGRPIFIEKKLKYSAEYVVACCLVYGCPNVLDALSFCLEDIFGFTIEEDVTED